MVASRQVEIPVYRGIGGQREQGLGALAQVVGRTASPFLRKYIVPAQLLEIAVPKIAELVSGREICKAAAMSVGDRL